MLTTYGIILNPLIFQSSVFISIIINSTFGLIPNRSLETNQRISFKNRLNSSVSRAKAIFSIVSPIVNSFSKQFIALIDLIIQCQRKASPNTLHIIFSYVQFFYIIHLDRKSTRLNSSHVAISYAVFC